jgi:hypothetical protein
VLLAGDLFTSKKGNLQSPFPILLTSLKSTFKKWRGNYKREKSKTNIMLYPNDTTNGTQDYLMFKIKTSINLQ